MSKRRDTVRLAVESLRIKRLSHIRLPEGRERDIEPLRRKSARRTA
jgi:hypothetical protein